MRHYPFQDFLKFGITTVTVLSAVGLAGCTGSPERTVTEDYPIFDQQATDQDVPSIAHSQDLAADMELPAKDVRWVGQHDGTDFYATLGESQTSDDDHVLCFIIAAHEFEVAGASCSSDPYDPSDPVRQARVGSTAGAVQAFLIPANAKLEQADGWYRASEHVVVLTDPSAQSELTGRLPDHTEITLQRITG